ncbi:TonB-dependent receptor [Microbulbifer marinus]|uniref:Outer membrane receptor proteins, mostly Fe transport n=1 Tax=Microbulbifer marinus TaxID=658218 RepID=A0A1H3WWQ6_9GAMM|nr:TonB-dependent receptor [Microbulbifer marinus]SDZ91573.1 Outer membrane receptor proteins, mostly Fe transport [Microbulbifer marinus]
MVAAASTAMVPMVEAQGQSVIEEVKVTATRRAQSVTEIPYNISAQSGEALEKGGITDFTKLARSIPGLTFVESGPRDSGLNSGLIIRGLNVEGSGSSDLLSIAAPTVSTYVGETPMFVNLHLKDIERVEVLRGPQGTLYGSGSLGGTIRYIPRKPDHGEFYGEVGTRGSYTSHASGPNSDTYGMVNLPVTDNLALRIVGGYVENQGFVDAHGLVSRDENGYLVPDQGDNPIDSASTGWGALGCGAFSATSSYCTDFALVAGNKRKPRFHNKGNVNGNTIKHARLSAAWDITDDVSALLTYQREEDQAGGRQVVNPDHPEGGEWAYNAHVLEELEREVDLLALDVEADLGFATLSASVSGYRNEADITSDQSGLYVNNLFQATAYYANMPMDVVWGDYAQKDEGKIAELRLVSNGDGPIDYVVGAFWLKQEASALQRDIIPHVYEITGEYLQRELGYTADAVPVAPPASSGFGPDDAFYQNVQPEYSDKALFGELTYHITDDWQATVGARFFQQNFKVQNDLLYLACQCETTDADDVIPTRYEGLGYNGRYSEQDFDDQIFKFNTSYQLSESGMLYFTWAEGFRHGGANAIIERFGDDPELEGKYDSDLATNWEVGLKGNAFDSRLNYTAALFYIDWEDMQFFSLASASGVPVVLNADQARTQGLELEATYYVTDNLITRFGLAYTDAEVTKDTVLPQIEIYKGDRLPGVPETSLNLGLEYHQSLDNGFEIDHRLNAAYTGAVQTDFNPAAPNYTESGSSTIVDFASAVTIDENWQLTLFVDNVFDERALGNGRSANSWNNAPYFANNTPPLAYQQNGYYQFANVNRPRTGGIGLKYTF